MGFWWQRDCQTSREGLEGRKVEYIEADKNRDIHVNCLGDDVTKPPPFSFVFAEFVDDQQVRTG